MNETIAAAGTFEQLGIIGVLFLVVVALGYVLKKTDERGKKCEESRLKDAEERGQLRERVARTEALAPFMQDQSEKLERLHKEALDALKELKG